jgi:hypothetical protein
LNSGGPYNETVGGDIYNNGRGRARPAGVPRNSLEMSGYSSLDLRASRDVKVGGTRQAARIVTLAVDAFNVLNQVNDFTFVGTVGSPLFGQPVSALWPRQLQFSAKGQVLTDARPRGRTGMTSLCAGVCEFAGAPVL